MKYRKKPVVIEAVQWNGAAFDPFNLPIWLLDATMSGKVYRPADLSEGSREHLTIATLEGLMTAGPGDWIIQGVKGEIYPCKPDIFEATYEPLGEEHDDDPRPPRVSVD